MKNANRPRISPQSAWDRMKSADSPILVCAYPEARYQQFALEGSISLTVLEESVDAIPKDREIIFY